eukprot:GHVH01008163.1.p1 GENE.GHVH01008163.1~~GHVH01008163.1.p1  ORF type:complete len:192 (+),score=13.26 GHVH01008163.1:785-1360(+)
MLSFLITSTVASLEIARPAYYEDGLTQMVQDALTILDTSFLKLIKKKDIMMSPLLQYTTTTTSTNTANPVNNDTLYCHTQATGYTMVNDTLYPESRIEYPITADEQVNIYQSCVNKITGPLSLYFPTNTTMVVRNGRCYADVYPEAVNKITCGTTTSDHTSHAFCAPLFYDQTDSTCVNIRTLPIFQADAP